MDEHMSGTDESPDAQQSTPHEVPEDVPPDVPRDVPPDVPRAEKPMKVVVYSHDGRTRAAIRLAIGRRPAPDVAPAEIIECATEPPLFRLLAAGTVAVMVLDAEAQPAGRMGACRQGNDEV